MANEIRLDHAGMEQMLIENCRSAVTDTARTIANTVETKSRVSVRNYTTDRAASTVAVANRFGLANEARTGALMRAAAALGLDVQAQ